MRARPRPLGLLLLGAAAALLIAAIASLSLDKPEDRPVEITGAGEVQRLFGGIEQRGAALGSPEAQVTIELFNDLHCGDCDDYQLEVVPKLVEDLVRPGEAQLVYRHFPLGRRERVLADYGAVAAAEQERQWQYVQLFFINQDELPGDRVDEEFLARIAAAVLQLDSDKWRSDLKDTERIEKVLETDTGLAAQLQLPAEPVAIVRGPRGDRELEGRPTAAQIEAAVREVG